MNSKSIWWWGIIAAGMFAFIFFFERHIRKEPAGPTLVLPGLQAAGVSAISITPAGHPMIHLQRTNESWQLTEPVHYPAQSTNVDMLLNALANLTSYAPITPAELSKRSRADEEFGFVSPQATVILFLGDQTRQILFGSRTAPGDQVFLRVVGVEDIFIVDAGLLDLLPRSVDDWRSRSFIDFSGAGIDRLAITTGGNVFELQRDATNAPWRFLRPLPARADNEKFGALLEQLPGLQVNQFASDQAGADLDAFGLQPPDLELNFCKGTNSVFDFEFGKSPTNDPGQVYARKDHLDTVVVVSNSPLTLWRSAFDNLRDRHLLSAGAIDSLEIHAVDNFKLVRGTNQLWQVEPQNFLADSNFMAALLVNLSTMQVTQFVKDAVTDPDLPGYGLATPSAQWIIRTLADATNNSVQLNFGAVQGDQMFVKRSDEDSVYAIPAANFQWLPSASWQMRDRQVWNFDAGEVTNIVVRQGTRERQINRTGPHSWALAAGSQGMINDLAIDQLVPRFSSLTAAVWTARSPTNLTQLGFNDKNQQITFTLKGGGNYTVEFGGAAPSQFPYGSVTLDGEQWVFEFPWDLYQLELVYFSIPDVLP